LDQHNPNEPPGRENVGISDAPAADQQPETGVNRPAGSGRFDRRPAPGTDENAYTPPAPAQSPVPTAAPADTAAGDAEVMTNLPHSRPQRRSNRRAPAKPRKATSGGRTARKRTTTASGKRSNAKKSASARAGQRKADQGLTDRAIGIAIAPIKLGASVTRRALSLIGRGIPRI
jgi:hypothetical protein